MMLSNLSHVSNKDGIATSARSGQDSNNHGHGKDTGNSGGKKKRETKLKLPITHNLELDMEQKKELLQREVQSFRTLCELNAEELQFKHRLLALINKRKLLISYIRDFFKNRNTFWLNSVSFTSSEIYAFIHNEAFHGKAVEYYYLADSLCVIHDTCNRKQINSQDRIQAYSQLFEEWEYHFQGQAIQSMKYVMAKAAVSATPSLNAFGGCNSNSSVDKTEQGGVEKNGGTSHAEARSSDSDDNNEGIDEGTGDEDEKRYDVQKRPSISIKHKSDVKPENSTQASNAIADKDASLVSGNGTSSASVSKQKLRVAPSPPQEKRSNASAMSPDVVSNTDTNSLTTPITNNQNMYHGNNSTHADVIKTHLYKYNNSIVYEHLRITPIPFSLDLVDVIDACSNTLLLFYDSLSLPDGTQKAVLYDAVLKLDNKLKQVYFNVLLKEMKILSDNKVKHELESIRLGML
jgi:hypothetical protein